MANVTREQALRAIASDYVIKGLGGGDFETIPYAENVELRAPINPTGSHEPLIGRSNLKEQWWAPLPTLVAGTELIDTYINAEGTKVAAEFLCHIKEPRCTLRIVDRFTVNEENKITAQENFFDPRDLTHPGWRG